MTEQRGLQRQWTLLPSTLGEAREVAGLIAASEFVPKAYQGKPDAVLIAIQMGADIGLSPMQALQNIAVINGRPCIWGDAALALAMPALESFKESIEGDGNAMKAICEAKRKGWPDTTVRTFSVADATKAGLWGKAGPWTNYPRRMLQLRARGFCLRDVAPDLLLGFILAEEAQDLPREPTFVGTAQTAPAKAMTVFKALPEAMQDNINKAFTTLHFSTAQGLQKLNEYFGGEGIVPEEAAQKLLDWLRDEFAKRKTGKPRKANGNAKKAEPTTEAPAVAESETPVGEAADALTFE